MNSVASIALTAALLGLSSFSAIADTFDFGDRYLSINRPSTAFPEDLSTPPITFSGQGFMQYFNVDYLFIGDVNNERNFSQSGSFTMSFDRDLSSITFNGLYSIMKWRTGGGLEAWDVINPSSLKITFLNDGMQVGSITPVNYQYPEPSFSSAPFDQAVFSFTNGSQLMMKPGVSCDYYGCKVLLTEFPTYWALDRMTYTVAAPVPEPSSYALLGLGLLLMGGMVRKRRYGEGGAVKGPRAALLHVS